MITKADEFVVTLIFDENGVLEDVLPGPGKKEEGYTDYRIESLEGKKCFSASTILYGHGSPGYTIYKTRNSYKVVEKPQP